jgi:hypothetical protein
MGGVPKRERERKTSERERERERETERGREGVTVEAFDADDAGGVRGACLTLVRA